MCHHIQFNANFFRYLDTLKTLNVVCQYVLVSAESLEVDASSLGYLEILETLTVVCENVLPDTDSFEDLAFRKHQRFSKVLSVMGQNITLFSENS